VDVLAKLVQMFEQTILMVDWLGRKQFSIEEVEKCKKIFFHSTVTKFLLKHPKEGRKRFQAGHKSCVTSFSV